MIEQIIDVEIGEMIRFYGSIVGTPGVSPSITKKCNNNIERLLGLLDPKVDKVAARVAGIITK